MHKPRRKIEGYIDRLGQKEREKLQSKDGERRKEIIKETY